MIQVKPQPILSDAQVQKAVNWLDQVEARVDELLAGAPQLSDNELDNLKSAVARCKDYAWALKTFPVFDPAALQMRKLQKIEIRPRGWVVAKNGEQRSIDKAVEVELNLPAFATMQWTPMGGTMQAPIEQLGEWQKNLAAIAKALDVDPNRTNIDGWGTQLSAVCPKPPASVTKNVEHVRGRFEDITIAYEAEWAQAPVRDPLVLGRIAKTWFLIDEYDATKLERYVASEFTRRPKT